MKNVIPLLFLISCSRPLLVERPSWVESIRKGEETLKVTNGSKTYYRRIAGSKDVSKQTSCNLVIMKAEEDLKKEFPLRSPIPYVLEVLYYDPEYQDCAVTISVYEKTGRTVAEDSKESDAEKEASEAILKRSETALKFALTGITKIEFERFAQDKVQILNEENLCSVSFRTHTYSIHGLTHVCWKGDIVAGYCTTRDKQCWTRTP